MFCEKCGKEITGFEKTCPGCGAAIEPENENVTQPVTQTGTYSESATPDNTAAKEPISKKTLTSIIGCSLAVIAIIVGAIIIFPMITAINAKDYIKVSLQGDDFGDNLYNGHFRAEVSIDEDKLIADNSINEYESFFESVEIDDVTDYCDINVTVKGRESDNTEETDDEDYTNSARSLTKDDILVISLNWPESEEILDEIEQYEDELGINFTKKDSTFEIKVSDVISTEGYSVFEPINFNFFDTMKDLFLTKGYSDDTIEFTIKSSTETKLGDYIFKYSQESERIMFSNDSGETVGSVKVSGMKNFLSEGDVVTITLEDDHVDDTGIFFTETSKDFTIKANSPLTAEEAKSNIKLIKDAVVELDTENNSEYGVYGTTVVKAFLFNVKDSAKEDEEYDKKLVTISKDKIDNIGTKYVIKVFNDPSIVDGKLVYTEASYLGNWFWGWYDDTLKEAVKSLNNDVGNIDNYTRTTILS